MQSSAREKFLCSVHYNAFDETMSRATQCCGMLSCGWIAEDNVNQKIMPLTSCFQHPRLVQYLCLLSSHRRERINMLFLGLLLCTEKQGMHDEKDVETSIEIIYII